MSVYVCMCVCVSVSLCVCVCVCVYCHIMGMQRTVGLKYGMCEKYVTAAQRVCVCVCFLKNVTAAQ